MIVLMIYSALVALIVAAAARAVEWIARIAGVRVRWIWAAALALSLVLSLSAALRGTTTVVIAAAEAPAPHIGSVARTSRETSWLHALRERVDFVRQRLDAPLRGVAAEVHRTVSPGANVSAAVLWSAMSIGLALVVVGVGRRFRNARRNWPHVTVQGVGVRVAPRIGPVVIGVLHPDIIVPRWLLARDPDEQTLVVTHENEHVRARDPLLLGVAWGAVVLAPWNPVIWYMLSRLRLAIELDCDARVLRRGAAPRSYGALLIDVAQHALPLRLSALALADDSSHLHQRILAMKPSIPRFARMRCGLAAAFAAAGVLVACQATLPTDAEIERMDVASATRAARAIARTRHADTNVTYTVDGRTVTASEATALAPDAVAGVRIVTAPEGKPSLINIETRKMPSAVAVADSGLVRRRPLTSDGKSVTSLTKAPFTGLIFIDGARATESQLHLLDPKQIESVEVLKGQAAADSFKDPEAANGVITITTKRGGAK